MQHPTPFLDLLSTLSPTQLVLLYQAIVLSLFGTALLLSPDSLLAGSPKMYALMLPQPRQRDASGKAIPLMIYRICGLWVLLAGILSAAICAGIPFAVSSMGIGMTVGQQEGIRRMGCVLYGLVHTTEMGIKIGTFSSSPALRMVDVLRSAVPNGHLALLLWGVYFLY